MTIQHQSLHYIHPSINPSICSFIICSFLHPLIHQFIHLSIYSYTMLFHSSNYPFIHSNSLSDLSIHSSILISIENHIKQLYTCTFHFPIIQLFITLSNHLSFHYIHTYIHTYIYAYTHTCIHTYIHTYTYSSIYISIHLY